MYFPEQSQHDEALNNADIDLLRIHSLETFGTHDAVLEFEWCFLFKVANLDVCIVKIQIH